MKFELERNCEAHTLQHAPRAASRSITLLDTTTTPRATAKWPSTCANGGLQPLRKGMKRYASIADAPMTVAALARAGAFSRDDIASSMHSGRTRTRARALSCLTSRSLLSLFQGLGVEIDIVTTAKTHTPYTHARGGVRSTLLLSAQSEVRIRHTCQMPSATPTKAIRPAATLVWYFGVNTRTTIANGSG